MTSHRRHTSTRAQPLDATARYGLGTDATIGCPEVAGRDGARRYNGKKPELQQEQRKQRLDEGGTAAHDDIITDHGHRRVIVCAQEGLFEPVFLDLVEQRAL